MEILEINVLWVEIIVTLCVTANIFILLNIYKHNNIASRTIFHSEALITWLTIALITNKISSYICVAIWTALFIATIITTIKTIKNVKDTDANFLLEQSKRDIKFYTNAIKEVKEKLNSNKCDDVKSKKLTLKTCKSKLLSSRYILTKMENRDNKSDTLSTKEAFEIVFNPAYYNM